MNEFFLARRLATRSRHAGAGGRDFAPARRVRPELAESDGGGDGGGIPAPDLICGGAEVLHSGDRADSTEVNRTGRLRVYPLPFLAVVVDGTLNSHLISRPSPPAAHSIPACPV